jgi:hypothetical protein
MNVAATPASPGGLPAHPAPVAPPPDDALASQPPDDTAESAPDSVTSFAEQVSRRAQLMLLRQQSVQADLRLRLDRMRADFNEAQEMRSEQLREMNALRDMAVEQGKKDDEILKKYIAMI